MPVVLARNADEAAAAAAPFLVDRLNRSRQNSFSDIIHKSEVGGVRLNLASDRAVREAVTDILARAHAARPDARLTGVTIYPMVVRPKAREPSSGLRTIRRSGR